MSIFEKINMPVTATYYTLARYFIFGAFVGSIFTFLVMTLALSK